MKRKTEQKNWPMRIASILAFLVVGTTCLLSGMLARFSSQADGTDNSRLAAYVFDVNDDDFVLEMSEIRRPGDTKEITFTVANYKADTKSETEQKYSIEIEITNNLPLDYVVKKADGTELPMAPSAGNNFGAKVENQILSVNVVATESYTLTANWPEDETDPAYATEIDHAEVIIRSEQID